MSIFTNVNILFHFDLFFNFKFYCSMTLSFFVRLNISIIFNFQYLLLVCTFGISKDVSPFLVFAFDLLHFKNNKSLPFSKAKLLNTHVRFTDKPSTTSKLPDNNDPLPRYVLYATRGSDKERSVIFEDCCLA